MKRLMRMVEVKRFVRSVESESERSSWPLRTLVGDRRYGMYVCKNQVQVQV